MSKKTVTPQQSMSVNTSPLIRVLVLGPLGSGKSAFANVILKRDAFTSKKSLGSKSVTSTMQHERIEDEGVMIEVCDTPAFEEISDTTLNREIKTGYDVIAIIVPVKRMTKNTEIVFQKLRKRFEAVASTHVMLILTFADELIESPFEFLTSAGNKDLSTLVKNVKTRMVVIDSSSLEERTVKRRMFVSIAKEMRTTNEGRRYSTVPRSFRFLHACRDHGLYITILIVFVMSVYGGIAYGIFYLLQGKQKTNSSQEGD